MDEEVKRYIEDLDSETALYAKCCPTKKLLLLGEYTRSPFLRSVMRKAAQFGVECVYSPYACDMDAFDGVVVCNETFTSRVDIPYEKNIDPDSFPSVTMAVALLLSAYHIRQDDYVAILGKGRAVKQLKGVFLLNGIRYKYVDTRYDDVLKATQGAAAIVVAAPLYPRCQVAHDTHKVVIDVTDAITKPELWGCPVVQHIGPLTISILYNQLFRH